jgi:hypothetical protein
MNVTKYIMYLIKEERNGETRKQSIYIFDMVIKL